MEPIQIPNPTTTPTTSASNNTPPPPSSLTDDGLLDTLFAPWLTPTSEPAFKLPPTLSSTISRPPDNYSRKRRRMSGSSTKGAGGVDSRMTGNSWFPDIPRILPHEKVYPIQIGNQLFRLSGASISSDAPSYFSQFFEQQIATMEEGQQIRTLYIDRDPETFGDIARHLQGYRISPRDGPHFVRLFADAQFYSLPKLISQLFESEIFISIGSKHFQINRDLFQAPGNSPNFFTLGFAVFFSNPSEIFPGLNREGLLRPPSILPPEVPNRSAEVFAELLHLLRGYPVQIRSEEHRQQLLRDCKYFHFKGLEQRLIPHEISYNPTRGKSEIVVRLEDIRPSGISFVPDTAEPRIGGPTYTPGWVNYSRPFVDDQARELIVEITGESTRIDWHSSRAEFTGMTNQRVSALLQVVTNKLGLPVSHEYPMGLKMINERRNGVSSGPASPGNTPLSDDKVRIRIGPECYINLDGEELWDRDGIPVVDVDHHPPPPPTETDSDAGRSSPIQWPSPSHNRPPSTKPQQPAHPPPPTSQALPIPLPLTAGKKRLKRKASLGDSTEWIMKRGQFRLRVQQSGTGKAMAAVLVGVKLEVLSGEYGRNSKRAFLV